MNPSSMTSNNIFLERMAVFAFVDKRPFCYKDFLFFEHKGKEYRFTHGTIRNILSKLRREGKIEFVYQTIQAYYTLPGAKVGKPITPDHGEDYLGPKQRGLLQFLQNLPMDKDSFHDVRLRFVSPGLWSILPLSSNSNTLIKNIDIKNNKDITLHEVDLKDHIIKTTVHKSNTVSVIVSCSESPIPVDLIGLSKLTSGLTRVEERLQRVVDEYVTSNLSSRKPSQSLLYSVPNHLSWIGTMWHFGRDSLTGYSGERFEITWEEGLQLFRVYSKEYKKNKTVRIRKEIQEYPNKSLREAFIDKLEDVGRHPIQGLSDGL
jgi:hypothetical protein